MLKAPISLLTLLTGAINTSLAKTYGLLSSTGVSTYNLAVSSHEWREGGGGGFKNQGLWYFLFICLSTPLYLRTFSLQHHVSLSDLSLVWQPHLPAVQQLLDPVLDHWGCGAAQILWGKDSTITL